MKVTAYEEVGRLVECFANDFNGTKNLARVVEKYKKRFRSLVASVEEEAKEELFKQVKEMFEDE